MVCGGFIGLERGYHKRPAGLRTHVLVCVGSMAVMHLSKEMFDYYYINYNYLIDPSRMSAQVVSGMGFIGAGTIIKHGTSIRGLTTAASIWCVAILGLCIGAGYYSMAIMITTALTLVLLIFHRLERFIKRYKNVYEVMIKISNTEKVMGRVNFLILKYGIKIFDMNIDEVKSDIKTIDEDLPTSIITLHLFLKTDGGKSLKKLASEIEDLKGVISVELL